mgnify:CR=1 FL=1
MKTKCLLCTALTETGQGFYDHLEDVHMMPIRRERITAVGIDKYGQEKGLAEEETNDECMERFKFTHPEYGTDICWCPDCIGGETLAMVNEVCSEHGQLYIKGEHKNG